MCAVRPRSRVYLPHLEKITDWAIANLDRERKPDTGTEWYTLSENLYRAYQLTGNPKYKTFGDVWRYTPYWNSFIGGTELTRYNHHAYSHVNTLSSAAMTYAITGEPEYLQIIVNAYDWLEKTQLFATGGYGPDERLLPPDGSLGESLGTILTISLPLPGLPSPSSRRHGVWPRRRRSSVGRSASARSHVALAAALGHQP